MIGRNGIDGGRTFGHVQANPWVLRLAKLQDVLADLAGGVARQRAALTVRMRRDRDADNLPMHIQQRTAALSGTEPGTARIWVVGNTRPLL